MEEDKDQISQPLLWWSNRIYKISFLHMVSMASNIPCIAVADTGQQLRMMEMLIIDFTE